MAAAPVLPSPRTAHFQKLAAGNPRLCRIVTPKLTKYIPSNHKPTVKQSAFLILDCLEGFYGGAASGGKSDALLMAALQNVDIPGYSALLLRRTFRELALPQALMSRATEWLGPTDAHWSPSKYTWTFQTNGAPATITFGYLQHAQDVYQYDSAEFQFIGFDELTQFEESQYKFLFSRLRRKKGMPVPLRMRSASNPGGVGHIWVKERFIKKQTKDRIFIKALRKDNPHVDQEEYERALQELDLVTRMQREAGDWDAEYVGSMFKRPWFDQFIEEVSAERRKCRFWDAAGTQGAGDYTVGALVSTNDAGLYVVESIIRGQWSAGEVDSMMKQQAELDGEETIIRIEQEPGASGKAMIEHYVQMLAGYDVKGIPSSGSKITRWKPFATQCEARNVKLLSDWWNSEFIDEMCAVPNCKNDDQADAVSGAFFCLTHEEPVDYGISFI